MLLCRLLIICAPKWRLWPRLLQQIIIFSQKSLCWAQETVTCFKPQKQMTAAQKFKARLSSQGHGRDVSTKHKQCQLRIWPHLGPYPSHWSGWHWYPSGCFFFLADKRLSRFAFGIHACDYSSATLHLVCLLSTQCGVKSLSLFPSCWTQLLKVLLLLQTKAATCVIKAQSKLATLSYIMVRGFAEIVECGI